MQGVGGAVSPAAVGRVGEHCTATRAAASQPRRDRGSVRPLQRLSPLSSPSPTTTHTHKSTKANHTAQRSCSADGHPAAASKQAKRPQLDTANSPSQQLTLPLTTKPPLAKLRSEERERERSRSHGLGCPPRSPACALMEFRGQGQEPVREMGASSTPPPPAASSSSAVPEEAPRYHECLRNHAAALGGHVVDGCGEFMPGAGAGDDALKCAACGCHRSFHRKDDGHHQRRQLALPPPPAPAAPRVQLLLPPPPHPSSYPHYAFPPYRGTPSGSGGTTTESSSEERGPPPAQGQQQPARRKRFRTRFTPEQKERMLAFAERLGWRMQKQDEALVDQFCAQVGVRRQVFKVWMHNNKHISRRQQQPQQEQQSQQQHQQQA